MEELCAKGEFLSVKYLYEKMPEVTTYAINKASKAGHIKIIKYL